MTDHNDETCGERDVFRPEDHVPDLERERSSRPSSDTNSCDASSVHAHNTESLLACQTKTDICFQWCLQRAIAVGTTQCRVVKLPGVDDCSSITATKMRHYSSTQYAALDVPAHQRKYFYLH